MSSILEALKRVEKESPKLDLLPEFKKLDARKAISRHARQTSIIYKFLVTVLITIVAGLGLWFAPAYKDLLFKKAHDRQTGSKALENGPVKSLDAADATREIGKAHDSQMKTTPHPSTVKAVRSEVEDVHEPKPVRKQEFTTEKPPAGQVTESQPEDAKFRLEAIVWAESPESRFAVINGQLIRIGESIEGISITAIERDHVAARSSGGEWKMKLTVK